MKIEIEKPRRNMVVEFYILLALCAVFFGLYIFVCSFFYNDLKAGNIFDFISKIIANYNYDNPDNDFYETVGKWKFATIVFMFCSIFPVWSLVYYLINLYQKVNLKYFIADNNSIKLVCERAGKTEVLQFLYDEIENFVLELSYRKTLRKYNFDDDFVVGDANIVQFDYISIGIDVKSNVDSRRLMLKQRIEKTIFLWNSIDYPGYASKHRLLTLRKDVNDIYQFIDLKNRVNKLSVIYGDLVPKNVRVQIEQYKKSLDISDNILDKPQLSADKQPLKSHIQTAEKKYTHKTKIPNVVDNSPKMGVIGWIVTIFIVVGILALEAIFNIDLLWLFVR